MTDDGVAKVGWIPVELWGERYSHRFCEAARHRGTFRRAVAVCVIAPLAGADCPEPETVWGVCQECLEALWANDFPREPLTAE